MSWPLARAGGPDSVNVSRLSPALGRLTVESGRLVSGSIGSSVGGFAYRILTRWMPWWRFSGAETTTAEDLHEESETTSPVPTRLGSVLLSILLAATATSGVVHVPTAAAALDSTGQWSPVVDWPIVAIHAALTPDGKVMTYGTTQAGDQGGHLVYDVWNPPLGTGTNSHTILSNGTPTDLFCSVQVMDPIRDVIFTAGGDDGNYESSVASNGATSYSSTRGLRVEPQMIYPRWYPSAVTLPDGDILIQGGSTEGIHGDAVTRPERFNIETGWTELAGIDSTYAYGTDQSRWWYPRSWVAPDGNVFGVSGSNMYTLDATGGGSLSPAGTIPAPISEPRQRRSCTGRARSFRWEVEPFILRIGINLVPRRPRSSTSTGRTRW